MTHGPCHGKQTNLILWGLRVWDYETGHKAAREEPGKLRYFPNEIIVKFKKAARVVLSTLEV